MGKRYGIADLVAALSTVGFAVMLAIGVWFTYAVPIAGNRLLEGSVGAGDLGWFVILVSGLALLAQVLYVVRLVTARTPERVMLQLPVAFAVSLFALPVLLLRMAFPPDVTVEATVQRVPVTVTDLPTDAAPGGWLALVLVLLFVLASWRAMADERDQTPQARAQTEALLAGVQPRPAPPLAAAPASTPAPGDEPATTPGSDA